MNQMQALALTLVFEVPVMLWLARAQSVSRVLLVAVGASCLTHPLAWRIASVLSPAEYPVGIWLIEVGVVLVEGWWYGFWLRAGWVRSQRWSVLANAASFGAGWLILR